MDDIILFADVDESRDKILRLFDIAVNLYINVQDIVSDNSNNYKTTDYLKLHYESLSSMLNVIIDRIIGIDENILEYSYDLDGFDEIKYKFTVTVNKLKVLIDSVKYNIYYNIYTVKTCIGMTNNDFDPEIPNYKSILKIIKASDDYVIIVSSI